jgi:hypothetical protein
VKQQQRRTVTCLGEMDTQPVELDKSVRDAGERGKCGGR